MEANLTWQGDSPSARNPGLHLQRRALISHFFHVVYSVFILIGPPRTVTLHAKAAEDYLHLIVIPRACSWPEESICGFHQRRRDSSGQEQPLGMTSRLEAFDLEYMHEDQEKEDPRIHRYFRG
jgi:hypothetical protein